MRANALAVRLALFLAFGVGLVLAGCKSSSTTGGGSPDPNKPDDKGRLSVEEAKRASANNLHHLGLAMHNYHDSNGTLPSAGPLPGGKPQPDAWREPHSWRVALLPHLEQMNLFFSIPKGGQGELPESLKQAEVAVFKTPHAQAKPTETHYRVFVGNGAAFDYGKGARFADFTDGLLNTILVVEAADPVSWTAAEDLNYDPKKPLPRLGVFEGGFHALMGDGHVRWIPSDTDEKTLRAMITRSGRETFKVPGKLAERSGEALKHEPRTPIKKGTKE